PLESQKSEVRGQRSEEICDKCGSPMLIKSGQYGNFLACSMYPECKTTKPLSTGVKCPLDKGDIIERRSRRGKTFWGCSNYPECKFVMWYKPVPKNCPACGSEFVMQKRAPSGKIYLACPKKGCGYKEEIKDAEF
ncbi:MAG: type I DNA topoisomerase, partial [Nitrospirota bacterium]